MKTTLRYLLSMVMVLSVLSLSAQTPKYGRIYTPQYERSVFATAQAQMPTAEIGSTRSDWMTSGSSLPNAAVTGTTMADETGGRPGTVHRSKMDENPFGDETIGGTTNPMEPGTPIGDGLWAMMLLACAYLGMRVFLKRKRALKG